MKKIQLKALLPFPESRILSGLMLVLSLGSGVMLAIISTMSMQPTEVMSELDVLQGKILTLQDSVNKPTPAINLYPMTQQIQQLSQQLDDVRAQNSNHLDQALNQTETTLAKQLNDIQQRIRHLDDTQSPIKYLPSQSLPFTVVSLDSIQHVPVASIAYDFKNIALEKGDSLAGWRVISIDYGTQRIEFENNKKEHVLVKLEQIGSGEL